MARVTTPRQVTQIKTIAPAGGCSILGKSYCLPISSLCHKVPSLTNGTVTALKENYVQCLGECLTHSRPINWLLFLVLIYDSCFQQALSGEMGQYSCVKSIKGKRDYDSFSSRVI